MIVNVLGTRKLNFKSNDGSVVQGTQIFVYYQTNGVDGFLADKVFVRADSSVHIPKFEYGEQYNFIYDGFGRKQYLSKIEKV